MPVLSGKILALEAKKLLRSFHHLPVGSNKLHGTAISSTHLTLQQLQTRKMYFQPDKKNNVRWQARPPTVYLDQIGGYPEVLRSLSTIVSYLQDPSRFSAAGIDPPRGVILSGPPGTGKTMMAEAIAGQAGVPIIMVSGADLISSVVGRQEEQLREIFEVAKQNAPCVLCFDEIDAIAGERFDSVDTTNKKYANAEVDQFLSLLSGPLDFVVIGTTNKPKILDRAVIRPGRFDKHIVVPLPDEEARISILNIHLKDKKIDPTVSVLKLASLSADFSGAKIASWIKQAATAAFEANHPLINYSHFVEARSLLENGALDQIQKNEKQKEKTAIHEAGHALVGHILGGKLVIVSVKQSNDLFGFTEFIPEPDNQMTKSQALNLICRCLAGRAAEELFDEPHSGAQGDLEKAKWVVDKILSEGMGETLSNLGGPVEGEIILKEQMKRAKDILLVHKKEFDLIKDALIKNNELDEEKFLHVLAGKHLTTESSGLLSFLFPKAPLESKPKNFIPARKPYLTLEQRQANKAKLTTALTIENVAKALRLSEPSIREIKSCSETNNIEIHFKPYFYDHEAMEKLSRTLNQFNIANTYLEDVVRSNLILVIKKEGVNNFIQFIQDNPLADNTPRFGR